MLVKTALLVISNPHRLGKILPIIKKDIENTLYIQVLGALSEPFGCYQPNTFNSWPKFSNLLRGIYTQAAVHCQNLDVRVLLSGLKYKNIKLNTEQEVELVIFDQKYSSEEIESFLFSKLTNISKEYKVMTYDNIEAKPITTETVNCDKTYQHTVLGGTFDKLHLAHKLLITEAALRSNSKITIGVTEENMLQSKVLWELIEPLEVRMKSVENFIKDICPELKISVEPIRDIYGPTQHDPTIDLLVVSSETERGGEKVNEVRQKKGLPLLDILPVELLDDPYRDPYEEEKISSNTERRRLLGTLLKPVQPRPQLPKNPYVIGLTGGIASGKSTICKKLERLGAHTIDCDKIGHGIYKKGKPCYNLIIKEFGEKILTSDGDVDRKVLGSIVFSDKDKLNKLNSLLWPAMAEEISEIIKTLPHRIVILEAAVLLQANWDKYCHEVWSCIIPPEEAIKRMQQRNLTETQARERLSSQPSNQTYVQSANVVFCSLWPEEYTEKQVNKAWELLLKRV